MRQFLIRRWFLLSLAVVLVVGFSFSAGLLSATQRIPRDIVVAGVMFLMALPLDSSQIFQALRRPGAVGLAVGINFGLLPLLAWGISLTQSGNLAIGLLIAASSPCTLASAVVWTRRAGGNDAVALMVTLLTNLICFVVTPFWLVVTTGTEVELDVHAMISKLALVVVLPTFLAQGLRLQPTLGAWATRHKIPLGVGAQCGILTMVFIGAVSSGSRLQEITVPLWQWGAMLGSVVVIHTVMLFVGLGLGWLFRFHWPERIAIGISGSQKTLAIGLYVALQYFHGLAMLPMVCYHISQLLIDTVIADQLKATVSPDETKDKPAEIAAAQNRD